MVVDLFIKNATIVTVNKNRDIFYNHSLAVKKDRIIDIGPDEELGKKYTTAKKVIDASEKIIFPGLINTHTHLFQTLLKGLGDDLVLSEWLATMTAPCAVHLQPEDVYNAALLGCIEGIHSGTTTMVDYMYPHPVAELSDGVINAFRRLKIRGIYGRGTMNTGKQFGIPEGIMQDISIIEADCKRLFKRYHGIDNDRIRIWLAPAATWSNSKELLKKLWEFALEYDTGFTIHISETPFDREASEKLHGVTDAELLQQLGIIGPNVLMVHCVHLNERDQRMAKYYDMKVSHNPVSNMYLSSGVAPIPKMINSGITVGLATDGAASNNSQDMIETLKTAALLQKVHTMDPTVITAEKVLEMATIDGARALGLDKQIGSLEKGKKADLFIFNPKSSAKSTPLHHPVSTLVYSSSEKNIETVVIDGNIVMENGIIKTANEKEVIINAQSTADDLVRRAAITYKKDRPWRSLAF